MVDNNSASVAPVELDGEKEGDVFFGSEGTGVSGDTTPDAMGVISTA